MTTLVTTEDQLNAAIAAADAAGANAGTIEIDIQGKVVEASDPTAINLAAGNTLVIKGVADTNGIKGTLDGASAHRGLFVFQGQVAIQDLTIENGRAQGGDGGSSSDAGGGGGAGLGGGLFVAGTTDETGTGGHVTLTSVSFLNNAASGGNGGYAGESGDGGSGGALAGHAAAGVPPNYGAGGSVGGDNGSGGAGGFGGGGGGGHVNGGGGGFGGGGGSGRDGTPGSGGFGAGNAAGYGGGGGGLGAGGSVFVQQGGSLAIVGGAVSGGAVAGGGRGSLTFNTNYAQNGQAYGSGFFFQGDGGTLSLSAGADGSAATVTDDIADQTGSAGSGGSVSIAVGGAGFPRGQVILSGTDTYSGTTTIAAGSTLQVGQGGTAGLLVRTSAITDDGTLAIDRSGTLTLAAPIGGAGTLTVAGGGTLTLSSANTYSGGTTLTGGRLALGAAGTAGTGAIAFGAGAQTLEIDAVPVNGRSFANTLTDFGPGDSLDLAGLSFAAGAVAQLSGSTLTVTSSGTSETFTLTDPAQASYAATSDGHGGTQVTAYLAPTITGTVAGQTSADGTPIDPFAHVALSDANPGATETLTIALSGAGGALSGTGLSGGNGTYTLTGTASAVTTALQALSFQPNLVAPGSSAATTFTLTDQSSVTPAATATNSSTTVLASQTVLRAAGQPIVVTTLAQLDAAITSADTVANQGAIEIDIQGKILEVADPTAINLATGNSLLVKGIQDGTGVAGTLDGAGSHRGLFAFRGDVTVEDLTIQNARATGGAGGAALRPGGGGAGLGGGLFVGGTADGASLGANVKLANVRFLNDGATGGAGGAITATGYGGGGGLGGAGGPVSSGAWAGTGGGGIGGGANGTGATAGGGYVPTTTPSGAGIVAGAASGGGGTMDDGVTTRTFPGGADGGGGGIGDGDFNSNGAGGGILGGAPDPDGYYGGTGGFGGGGGAAYYAGGNGGFGGGGGGGSAGGNGGFGGGGAGKSYLEYGYGIGGFGAGNGGGNTSSAGGGLGAGGAVFVQQGGNLTIEGGVVSGGSVAGGQGSGGGGNGQGYGSGLFLQGGSGTLTLAGGADGSTLAVPDAITDQQGSAGGTNPGRSVTVGTTGGTNGPVLLSGANSYSGGTTLNGGLLELDGTGAAGSGTIAFGAGPAALRLSAATLDSSGGFANGITGFAAGDTLDLAGLAYTPGATATRAGLGLSVTSGGQSDFVTLAGSATRFITAPDYGTGTAVLTDLPSVDLATPGLSQPEGNSGTTAFTYTLTRSGGLSTPTTVSYAVAGSGAHPADAADFGGTLPSGTVTFAEGVSTATITVPVSGDTAVEPDEGFTLTLTGATNGTLGTATSATGVILDDDTPPPSGGGSDAGTPTPKPPVATNPAGGGTGGGTVPPSVTPPATGGTAGGGTTGPATAPGGTTDQPGSPASPLAGTTRHLDVTGEPYTAADVSYDDQGRVAIETLYGPRGNVYQQSATDYAADGSAATTTSGGAYFARRPFFAYVDRYAPDGTETEEDVFYKDGHQTVQALVQGATLASIANDTFYPQPGGDNTFTFMPGFGHDTITSFVLGGPDHDTIQLPAGAAGRLGALLAHATSDSNGDAVLHLDPNDSITIQGVGLAALRHHPGVFGFG